MGLGEFFGSGMKFDYLFMEDGSSDTAKMVSANQERIVQRQHAEGLIDDTKQANLLQEIAGTTTYDTYFTDPANRPTTAFFDEVKVQAMKLPNNIRDIVGNIVTLPFKLIPTNLWILIIVAILVYVAFKLNVLSRFAYRAPK